MTYTTVSNLGQYGVMPDVAAPVLPSNAFTYARNWRFQEGDFAEVSQGYQNALDSRNLRQLGDSSTSLSFLYTWILNDQNAFFAFDRGNGTFRYVENNGAQQLIEYDLSVRDQWSATMTYTDNSTPGAGQFTVSAAGELVIHVQSADITTLETANQVSARVEIYDLQVLNYSFIIGTDASHSTGTEFFTFSGLTGLPRNYVAGQEYILRVATPFVHDTASAFEWEATDAFGLPIFMNRHENPWVYTDATVPYLSPLTNWPANATARTLTKFNAFLVAVGYQNPSAAAGFQGSTRTIAISDVITTPGTLPMWDFADTQSFSQIIDLSLYTDGDVLSAYEFNSRLYINTTTDVLSMVYEGNGEFALSRLPFGTGTISTRATVPIQNGAFNIGNGQFYTHDGSSYQTVGEGIWTNSWFASVDDERLSEVQMVYDTRNNSVWIKTPTSTTSQEIWILNLDTGSMSILDDHQEIGYMLWSAEGVPATSTTWDSFQPDIDWDTIPQEGWNDFPFLALGEFRNRILSCGGREIYVHDFGTTYNGRTINAVLQKEYIKGSENSYGSFQFNTVIPWIEGRTGSMLDVRVGTAPKIASTPTWTPYRSFNVGVTRKRDFRLRANWGAIGFRSQTSGTRLSGYEIDVGTVNRR